MLKNSCVLSSLIFLSLFFPAWTEEGSWMLAAEKFTTDQIPVVYEDYSSVIPYLLLGKLSIATSRRVLPDEIHIRLLQKLAEKKMNLVSERSKLLFSRDMLLFSNDSYSSIKKKSKAALLEIKKKEEAISEIDLEIASAMKSPPSSSVMSPITLWKKGAELFVFQDTVSKKTNLEKSGISALISGNIEDLAGYMCITITIETGLSGYNIPPVSSASRYEDFENAVDLLVMQLLPILANRNPVELILTIKPENSRVFIDERLVDDATKPLFLYSGEHHIRCDAPGFESAQMLYDFSEKKRYSVSIDLNKEKRTDVSFNSDLFPTTLFLRGDTVASDQELFQSPLGTHIGEIISEDVTTWFVLDVPEGDSFERVTIQKNKVNTQKRIEGQRRLFYNSLGALYISLPVTLLLKGKSENMTRAFMDYRLEQTQEMVNTINSWTSASMISQGISITLGINVVIQLVRYFIAAEQAVPEQGLNF